MFNRLFSVSSPALFRAGYAPESNKGRTNRNGLPNWQPGVSFAAGPLQFCHGFATDSRHAACYFGRKKRLGAFGHRRAHGPNGFFGGGQGERRRARKRRGGSGEGAAERGGSGEGAAERGGSKERRGAGAKREQRRGSREGARRELGAGLGRRVGLKGRAEGSDKRGVRGAACGGAARADLRDANCGPPLGRGCGPPGSCGARFTEKSDSCWGGGVGFAPPGSKSRIRKQRIKTTGGRQKDRESAACELHRSPIRRQLSGS